MYFRKRNKKTKLIKVLKRMRYRTRHKIIKYYNNDIICRAKENC